MSVTVDTPTLDASANSTPCVRCSAVVLVELTPLRALLSDLVVIYDEDSSWGERYAARARVEAMPPDCTAVLSCALCGQVAGYVA